MRSLPPRCVREHERPEFLIGGRVAGARNAYITTPAAPPRPAPPPPGPGARQAGGKKRGHAHRPRRGGAPGSGRGRIVLLRWWSVIKMASSWSSARTGRLVALDVSLGRGSQASATWKGEPKSDQPRCQVLGSLVQQGQMRPSTHQTSQPLRPSPATSFPPGRTKYNQLSQLVGNPTLAKGKCPCIHSRNCLLVACLPISRGHRPTLKTTQHIKLTGQWFPPSSPTK